MINSLFNYQLNISDKVLSQEIDGETVLLDLQSESYFGLDEVGTRIWQLLSENKSLDEVHQVLMDEYDVESSRLVDDIERLIASLSEAGLVSRKDTEK